MQSIFIDKRPYEFVTPVMNEFWPKLMNRKFILNRLLKKTESVESWEVRGLEKIRQSIDDGDAVIMIPNHPRTSDPVAMYHVMRELNCPMFVMASWHLFNQSMLNTMIIRLYGGFSVNREGMDRKAVNFAISNLVEARRPLLVFPEGATSRTNDSLMPFLEGTELIARSVARKRKKKGKGKTVVHPIAIRYLYRGDVDEIVSPILEQIESRFTFQNRTNESTVKRLFRIGSMLLSMKELEYGIVTDPQAPLHQRQIEFVDRLLGETEQHWFGETSDKNVSERIRELRTGIFPPILSEKDMPADEKQLRWRDLKRTYLAWQVASYPPNYLHEYPSVDRIIEITDKFREDLTDEPRNCATQSLVIQVGDPIEVSTEKSAAGQGLLDHTREALLAMMGELQNESAMLR